jgi:hypothetical protein
MRISSYIKHKTLLLLSILFIASSCSSTIHLLSSWGIPLESKLDNDQQSFSFKKNNACQNMVSLLIKEKYLNKQKLFENSVAKQYGQEAGNHIISNVNLLLSLDYSISLSQLLRLNSRTVNFKTDSIKNVLSSGDNQELFNRSLTANNYLLQSELQLSPKLALELQNLYMVKSLKKRGFRKKKSWRRLTLSSTDFERQLNILQNNKYLITTLNNGFVYSHSPSISHLSTYVKKIIADKAPQLDQDIDLYIREFVGDEESLNQRLLATLIDNLFSEYRLLIKEYKNVKNKRVEELYIKSITKLFLDFVSLRPFADHSSLIARDLAFNLLFKQAKLIKPRIYISKNILASSLTEWTKLISAGMLKTEMIYSSILRRGELNLPISNTPELLTNVKSLKFDNLYNNTLDNVKFKTFLRQTIEHNPNLISKLLENPFLFSKSMSSRYKHYLKEHNLDKNSDHYVSDDFTHYFKQRAFRSQSTWSYKMNNFYKNTILWKDIKDIDIVGRGHLEVISLFKDLHKSLNSNQAIENDLLLNASLENFDEFNQDIIRGGITDIVNELVLKGENYKNSYGFLTYKNLNKLRQSISKLSKRSLTIVVGHKKSTKDLDLKAYGNNKTLEGQVLAIGAIDPDAIMIVHTLDAKGEIISSYIRDQERPWRILVFKGQQDQKSYHYRSPASIINLSR